MRERLAQYYGETLELTAHFQAYGRTAEGRNMACFACICLDGDELADHVWMHRSGQMKDLRLAIGDVVEFEARVGRYVRNHQFRRVSEIEYDYNLEKIRDMRVLKRAKGKGA